ncbi:MAG: SPOR domain-containing protein [Gallionella sp.]|nr:SPOR domain-containing protein [Gallionella sp.]
MAKELTDDELNLRRMARRRLIGAIALTLAVVVILPMVLDREPKPSMQDIELRIPDPDKAGEFVPGVVSSEVVAAIPVAEIAVASAPAMEAASAVTTAEAVKPPEPEPKAADPVTTKTSETAPVAADAAGGGTGYAVQVGAYSNPKAAKQEFDRLKQRGFKVYTEQAGKMTRVRIGPYAERAKAEKVVKLLEQSGIHPSIVSAK